MADFPLAIFCFAGVVIFCCAAAEASTVIFCSEMCCSAMKESSSATNDGLMVVESSSTVFPGPSVFCGAMADSFSAVFCNALVDSSLLTNDSLMVESPLTMVNSTLGIFGGAVGDLSTLPSNSMLNALSVIFCGVTPSKINDCPMAESSSLIKDTVVAESSLPIDEEVWRLVCREKISDEVSSGAANFSLWRLKNIWAIVLGGATTIWGLFLQLGDRMLNLIILCLASVLYLGPAATNFIYKAFVILREINRGFAEIIRGFAEINRCFAEIKSSFSEITNVVAVLRRIMLRKHVWMFLIAFFLVFICILYASSPTHIHKVSTQLQMIGISKDLIVNITVSMRDNEGLVIRREFTFQIATMFRRCVA